MNLPPKMRVMGLSTALTYVCVFLNSDNRNEQTCCARDDGPILLSHFQPSVFGDAELLLLLHRLCLGGRRRQRVLDVQELFLEGIEIEAEELFCVFLLATLQERLCD